jgi:hypothetical protein
MENNFDTEAKLVKEKPFFKSWNFWKPFLGITLGALGGFLYYHYVGCSSGSCAITGNPYMSTVYGGMLGLFLVNSPCSRGRC